MKQVTLVLKSANVSREVGSTPFKYVDHGSELIDKLLTNKELQSDFFEEFSKQMRSKCSGLQMSDNSGITEAGMVFYYCFLRFFKYFCNFVLTV